MNLSVNESINEWVEGSVGKRIDEWPKSYTNNERYTDVTCVKMVIYMNY